MAPPDDKQPDEANQSEELTTLIQGLMPMAEKMLDEMGAFLPYAAVLYGDGEIRHLTVDPDSGSHKIEDIVVALEKSLNDLANSEDENLAATALCMDIKMKPSIDRKDHAMEGIEDIRPQSGPNNRNKPHENKIFVDVERDDNDVDCIMLRLESIHGEAYDAFRPYAIDHAGHVRFSRMFATQSQPRNFK